MGSCEKKHISFMILESLKAIISGENLFFKGFFITPSINVFRRQILMKIHIGTIFITLKTKNFKNILLMVEKSCFIEIRLEC